MKFKLVLVVSLLVSGSLLFAGGGKEADEQTKKVTISVGGWGNLADSFKAALPGFNKIHPNINVEFEMLEWASHHQAMQTALAAGSGAHDVEAIEGSFISQFRNSKALENLLASPYNAEQYKDNFGAFKWGHSYSLDRKQYVAIPWDVAPVSFFYRADVFEDAGLPSDPEGVAKKMSTWEGVLDVARKVYIPGKRWLVADAVDLYNAYFFNQDYYDEKLNLRLDRPGDIECLNAVIEIRKNKLDMNASSEQEENAAYANAALVSHMAGCWWGGYLKASLDPGGFGKWRITTLPGNLPAKNNGGSYLGIPSQGKHKLEAWYFIEYMLTTKEGQNKMLEATDSFPALTTAWDDPLYNQGDPFYGNQQTRSVWKAIAAGLKEPAYTTLMDSTAQNLIGEIVNAGLTEGLNAQTIKQRIKTNMDQATQEQKRQQIQLLRNAGLWKD
jgi:multiple sugar transport system substrate-binding protein